MTNDEPMVPNVWICLQKIRGFLDGIYEDKDDVYLCIDTMEKMFKEIKIDLKHEGRLCRNGWIEDFNLSHYDMAHAIMPTETLSRREVQEELYQCYRHFYGSWRRKIGGVLSSNKLKSRLYRHMMGQGVLHQFKNLIPLAI